MKRRPLARQLLASAAIAGALLLAGCESDSNAPSIRSLQPISAQMLSEIEQRNMGKESPILVRLYKEESELEVWKEDRTGRFALLKTYPICRWSGELGPKIKEGDRQAPEGFYTITPSLMNPNSNYYLAINMGFPNAFDRANGRNGAFLMIHGDCSSRGCYAMTDEQIAEIYALARESFFGGQRSFQIQAYPFRMTALNMAKHRNSPHFAFWKMLKQGNDHFEVTRREPKVEVCDKRYVFNAESNGKFTPAAACPAYKVNEELVAAVAEKQQSDDREMAEYVRRGTATVPVVTRTDGGMHPTFMAAFQRPYTDASGVIRSPGVSLPGTIPAHASPPATPPQDPTGSTTRVAAASDSNSSGSGSSGTDSGGVWDHMSRLMGFKSEPAAAEPVPTPKRKPTPPAAKSVQTAATPKAKAPSEPAKQNEPKQNELKQNEPKLNAGAIRPAAAPEPAQEAKAEPEQRKAEPEHRPTSSAGFLNGAQPAVPAGSFDNRWGSFR